MKKILAAFLITLIITSCSDNKSISNSTKENTDWLKHNLRGSVKSYREIKFLAVDDFSIISNGEKVKHIYNKEVLFNLDGNKIEKNDYIPDGTLANRTVFLYKKDQLIEYNNYDSQGILFGTGKYETNENGQITQLNYRTNDGRFNWSESYEYDSDNNITEVKHFTTKEVIDTKEMYVFDSQGRIKESVFHRDNKLVTKNIYNYDKEGNHDQLTIGDASTYTYKYNYDAKGNWIKKIVFENDNPSGILVREIEYFN